MKKVVKIFLAISLGLGIVVAFNMLMFGFLMVSQYSNLMNYMIEQLGAEMSEEKIKSLTIICIVILFVAAFFGVACTVLSFIIIGKLSRAKSKPQLLVWSILALIFVNIIVGVLMLCIPKKEFDED